MTLRKHSPLHDKWHRRVEGQLRDAIEHHPRWFNFKDKNDQARCINSIAKRIVGEIVADLKLATVEGNCVDCELPSGDRLVRSQCQPEETWCSESATSLYLNTGAT